MDNLGSLANQIILGLARGSLLFLLSSGLTLTLGVLRIPNFAHAALCVLGGYISWTIFATFSGLSPTTAFWLSLLIGPAIIALVGGLMEYVFLRRLYSSATDYQILFTYGILLCISDIIIMVWGSDI